MTVDNENQGSSEERKFMDQQVENSRKLEKVKAKDLSKPDFSRKYLWISLAILPLFLLPFVWPDKDRNLSRTVQQKIETEEANRRVEAELIDRRVYSEEDIERFVGKEKSSASLIGEKVSPPETVEQLVAIGQGGRSETSTSRRMTIGDSREGSQFGGLGLPIGTEISGRIEQSIVSSDLEVPVVAIVSEEVLSGKRLVVPRLSKILGKTVAIHSENRLSVRFYRLVTPDEKEYPFSGILLMRDGSAGLIGKVHRKAGKRGGKIAASAALGATGIFMPRGIDSFGDAFARGAHSGSVSEVQRDLNQYEQSEGMPTIEVEPDQEVIIFVDRSI